MSIMPAMILAAGMTVPGIGPEKMSGEIEQGLDLGSRWEGIYQHANGELKAGMIGGRLVDLRNDPPAVFSEKAIDEGKGRLRMRVGGRDCLGIYRQDENSLMICYQDACDGYPISFKIIGMQSLFILHHVKPGK